jgi:predicted dehydrogenase
VLKFLVIGCGSIGKRHIENLKRIQPKSTIYAFDIKSHILHQVCKKYQITPISKKNIKDMMYDCVLVCTPPNTHLKYAREAIMGGSNVFIEKPISAQLVEINSFSSLAKKKKCLIFVGYNFRFNKSICIIKKLLDSKQLGNTIHVSAYFGSYLPDWRPNQDYSTNYTVRADLGGGIIHDGSHELDYLRYFFGNPKFIQSNYKKTKFLKSDTEAVADIILEFNNDLLATIHLDYMRRQYKRTLEILFEFGIVEWSLSESTIKIFNARSKNWKIIKTTNSINEMYINELKHVIKCIINKTQSQLINLKNGIDTFLLSECIKKSKRTGKMVTLR